MARVSSSDSPRRSVRASSTRVWARTPLVLACRTERFPPRSAGENASELTAAPRR
jgi:hypothetical protein